MLQRHFNIELLADPSCLPQKHPFVLDVFDDVNGKPEIERLVGMRDVIAVEYVDAVQFGDFSCLDGLDAALRNLDGAKLLTEPLPVQLIQHRTLKTRGVE